MTITHENIEYTIVSTDDASDKPSLRADWDQRGIADYVIATAQPKRKVLLSGFYRCANGSVIRAH